MILFTFQLSHKNYKQDTPGISMIEIDIFANDEDEATSILKKECSFAGDEYEIDDIWEN